MLLLTVSDFLNSGAAKVVFGVMCAGFLYLMYKVATRSTAPKGNQPNTGVPAPKAPGSPPPTDNRPKPPVPPKGDLL
jgi:hypothetical protein